MVRQAFHGVGDKLGFGVLHHHEAVPVVGVDQRRGLFGQAVEEEFLATEVFGKGLVVVQVVVGEVGEDAHRKSESAHTFLLHADGAHFHEAVLAAMVHHVLQQGVDGHRVGRGILCLQTFSVYIVGDGGKQAAGVAQAAEQVVQQRYRGGFPVGAGDAHQAQFPGRVAIELVCGKRQGLPGVLHHLELNCGRADPLLRHYPFGYFLADDARGTFGDGIGNVVVPVAAIASYGYEQRSGNHFPGIRGYAGIITVSHFCFLSSGLSFITGTVPVRGSTGCHSGSRA